MKYTVPIRKNRASVWKETSASKEEVVKKLQDRATVYDTDDCGTDLIWVFFDDGTFKCIEHSWWWDRYDCADDDYCDFVQNDFVEIECEREEWMPNKPRDWLMCAWKTMELK